MKAARGQPGCRQPLPLIDGQVRRGVSRGCSGHRQRLEDQPLGDGARHQVQGELGIAQVIQDAQEQDEIETPAQISQAVELHPAKLHPIAWSGP